MARRQEKRIRKLKKNHAWILFIIYTIMIFIASVIVTAFVGIFADYVIEGKLSAEYKSIEYMSKLYEKREKLGGAIDGYDEMLNDELDYVVRDKNGNDIFVNGNNTCSGYTGRFLFPSMGGMISVYRDSENGYVYVSEDGSLVIDKKALFAELRKINPNDVGLPEDGDADYDDAMTIISLGQNVLMRIPVWMAVDIKDGEEQFIGKVNLDISVYEVLIFIGMLFFLAVLAFVFFVIMLVGAINGILTQRRMFKVFFTDMVTNGHNWMWFLYRGEHLLRKWRNAKNTYAVVNLVFVKYRNYCVCHSISDGEKMLKRVYELISKRLDGKEMIAHVSNSNFAILLKYDDQDKLKMRLQSLILELEKIDSDHVFSFQAGVDTVGVWKNENGRIVRRKNIDLEFEYNNACTARATMAESDDSGVTFFDEKLVEDQKWIDKVTERQKFALEHEEFVVYYQPKYDPNTDKLRGAEALIRWQNDEMGFVPPGKFIPIFEKNGFITNIDHYMLEHVARDQKAWLDKGCKCVPISVNVSRAHFIESDLAEQIRDTVDAAGTPHELVEIELTESAFFDDKKALISIITRLKEYGFSVSMDDFGSGYSSLNSLKDMPLDVLKLDAEFFRGDTHGERGEIVVSEAIKLAKSLNMRTVAEGVEVKEQVDFLAEQGCDMIQGYYYAKPMPKDEFEQRM